jgi:hypothetical protein
MDSQISPNELDVDWRVPIPGGEELDIFVDRLRVVHGRELCTVVPRLQKMYHRLLRRAFLHEADGSIVVHMSGVGENGVVHAVLVQQARLVLKAVISHMKGVKSNFDES